MQNAIKHEIYNVLSGTREVSAGRAIQAVACYLNNGPKASPTLEIGKHSKKQEAAELAEFISAQNLWVQNIDLTQYVSEGAEQKVYLIDTEYVLKLNDSIYYSSWKDYFYNLLLHNYFFPDTAYELIGFTTDHDNLYAIVKQHYVSVTANTNLEDVRNFLALNGFINTRNNDYFHADLGIILEDLHDENVLTRNGILYFIDTVFFLTDTFWIL